jgi:hypothetical protein
MITLFTSTFTVRLSQVGGLRSSMRTVRPGAALVAAFLAGVVMVFGSAPAVAATTPRDAGARTVIAGGTDIVSASSPMPRALVSPGSLSFKVEVNEFNQTSIDSDPQPVTVRNDGTAPLSISAAKIVKSAGGFVINNACVATLVNDKYTFTCSPPTGRADTCSGATLAVGASCSVSVEYADAGLFPSASGSLEIDSNSPTSPDLVSLSGTSTFITAILIGAVPGGCPGVIADTESANPNTSAGSGILLGGCWASTGPGGVGATANSVWGAVGPVTINGDVTLYPTSPGDELFVSPSFAGGTAHDTIFATPSTAEYVVMVAPPGTLGATAGAASRHVRPGEAARAIDSLTPAPSLSCAACEPGTSWAISGPNTEPLGVANLGANPFVCSHAWEDALAPDYVGCDSPVSFGADSPLDTIHGLPILGGDIVFGSCGSESVVANAALPSLFSSTPVAGSSPPTAKFFFAGCKPSPPAGSGGPSSGPVTCTPQLSSTPACGGKGGTIIAARPPHVRDARSGSVVGARARTRLASRIAGGDPSCPSGDVDYTANTPASFVGAMDLGSPFLCYDPTRDVWTVGGTVGIASATVDTGPPPDYGIGFHSNGAFDHGGIQSVNFSPEVPLAPAVSLASFGGSFAVDPTRVHATAAVTVAGVLHISGGAFAVWANPSHPYTYQPGDIPGVASLQTDTQPPNQLTDFAAGVGGEASLDLPVVGTTPLASGYAFYAAPSYFEFGGCLGDCNNGLSLGLATLYANAQGALDTGNGEYNIAGSAKVCADFPIVGSVCPASLMLDASNQGLGACGHFLGITGGVIVTYGQGVQIEGGLSSSSCDLGPITVVVQRSRAVDAAVAHIAQAGGAVTLNLTGHPPSTSIYVKGTGGPPVLTLAGPHGERLSESADGHGVYDRRLGLVIWPEPKLDETLVSIDHPAPGAWTLTPLPGSPTISNVSYANAVAPARIIATVSGRGRARTLSYRIVPRAGQRVTFAERTGRVFHVLGVARGTNGKLRFTSALGPGGRREIVAEISLSGMPTPPLVVARYTAPPPPRAGKPSRLTFARRRGSLWIRWGAAANAKSYLCVVSLSDGLRTAYILPARQRSKIVPTVAPNATGRIWIIPITAMSALGPDVTAPLTPVRGPAKVEGLTITRTQRTVVVTWQRSAAASKYMLLLKLNRPRAPIYAPVLLRNARFVSKQTLPNLRPDTVATITVIAIGPTGVESTAGSIRFRAS